MVGRSVNSTTTEFHSLCLVHIRSHSFHARGWVEPHNQRNQQITCLDIILRDAVSTARLCVYVGWIGKEREEAVVAYFKVLCHMTFPSIISNKVKFCQCMKNHCLETMLTCKSLLSAITILLSAHWSLPHRYPKIRNGFLHCCWGRQELRKVRL